MSIFDRERAALLPDRLERLAAHVLHHDIALGAIVDEVVDADDLGVLDGGQELPLGEGCGGAGLVLGVEQPLQHHPARQRLVPRKIDPAQAAVGHRAFDFELARHQIACLEGGPERVFIAAVGAEALLAAQFGPAVVAEPLAFRHDRVGHERLQGVQGGHRGQRHQPGAERAAATAA
jgi:hypothetical protein